MTYIETLDFIHSRPRIKNTGDHSIMLYILDKLGNPQDKLKYIHISGTNGKGSCAAMCANILKLSGYKVGLNISPFVIDFRERIQINGEYISQQELIDIVKILKPIIDELDSVKKYISEFALVTIIAMYYFEIKNVDVVCLEVGMGGKNDCTNIIKNNLCACIMNIDFDHTRLLGDTIEKITLHKAGIIKQNCPAVTYPRQKAEALNIIMESAIKSNSKLIIPDINKLTVEKTQNLKYKMVYKDYTINQSFIGIHQSYNAMVVIETINCLNEQGFNIEKETVIKGIETTNFPRRIEILSKNPLIILDGSHNIDGINALTAVLKENNINNLNCIWASLSDKKPEEIINKLSPYIKRLYTIDLDNKRSVSSDSLATLAKGKIQKIEIVDSIEKAIDLALIDNKSLLICGSLYLASDRRKYLIKKLQTP